MNLINSLLNVFVGDKSKKDLKEVESIVKEILSHENELSLLNHNELRNKTIQFKNRISLVREPFNKLISELRIKISLSNNIDEKEKIYQEIDKINESSSLGVDEELNKILPEAFAVVKETAKRFKENSKIHVKASESDMRFSSLKKYISIEGENAIVGITKHATEILGDIVFVELPEKDSTVVKDGNAGVVESTKAASNVYTPVSGQVIENNQSIVDDPAKINSDPENEAWFFKLKIKDKSELDTLMNKEEYEKFSKESSN